MADFTLACAVGNEDLVTMTATPDGVQCRFNLQQGAARPVCEIKRDVLPRLAAILRDDPDLLIDESFELVRGDDCVLELDCGIPRGSLDTNAFLLRVTGDYDLLMGVIVVPEDKIEPLVEFFWQACGYRPAPADASNKPCFGL